MTLIQAVPGRLFKASLIEVQKKASQTNARNKRVAIKVRELVRVEYLGEVIQKKTDTVVKKTVNFSELPPFQQELVSALVNLDELRRALHSVGWAGNKVLSLSLEYRKKMRGKKDLKEITRLRKQFEKRAESIIEGVEKDVKIINMSAKALKKLPSVRKMKTLLIAGYPNVGKSSLLNKLSDSKVDVQPYPFTTKSILIGYMKHGYRRYQLVDTPGILDRESKNPVEQQAVAALKHLSDKMLFVIDPSGTCGYTIEQQKKLLEKIKKELNPDVLVVYSKGDLKRIGVDANSTSLPDGLSVSVKDKDSMAELKTTIQEWFEDKH